MMSTAPVSYDRAAEQVKEMVKLGTPFARVESAIENAHAPQDEKAALWLLAWSLPVSPREPGRSAEAGLG
jgi:hypothetical protein